jgi:methionyl-tRNA synthetase
MNEVGITQAIVEIWKLVDELNNYITTEQPWVLAKDEANKTRLATVLYCASEGLRVLTVLLSPVIPKATAKLWAALTSNSLGDLSEQNITEAGNWGTLGSAKVGELEVLFPRIENKDE